MANIILPAFLKKNITFIRLSSKNCTGYEIYGHFKDDSYASGIRTELLDTVDNPKEPNPVLHKIDLPKNSHPTWELPRDAFMDRDHKFYLYQNGFIISPLCYYYNKLSRLFTLDIMMKPYSIEDEMELEYYQDLVELSYTLEEDCQIKIKPIFKQTATFGDHNIII